MDRRTLLKGLSAGAAAAAAPALSREREAVTTRKPNFVIVLCDDLGYGDLGGFGAKLFKTPNIDRLAREGTVLTDYYAPANLCTPSRAGLLTGRYPIRTGLGYEVIMQDDHRGLPLSEVTIAAALKPDYATALFGKWHLGHFAPTWPPTNHGFDTFFGIPYSHDMQPLSLYESHAGSQEATPSPVDFPQLQQQFYVHAEHFIEQNRDRPFFVELALSAPHLPEYPHPPFAGTTAAGPYGDVVVEIDSLVGRLIGKLRELDLDRHTLVIFTSDNGPWFEGSSGGLRDRKGGGAFDGGYRVPFIAWYPGVIPAGRRVDSIVSGVDLLPTFCAMAGRPLPRMLCSTGAISRTSCAAALHPRTTRSCCSTTTLSSASGLSSGNTSMPATIEASGWCRIRRGATPSSTTCEPTPPRATVWPQHIRMWPKPCAPVF